MKQLRLLLKKEMTELLRSKKALVLVIVYAMFGIMNPALAKLTMGDLAQRRGKLASELETVEAAWMEALEAIETAAA